MNQIVDRKKAPKTFAVTEIPLPAPELFHLANGIPVYVVNMGNIDAVRIEVIFKAGRPHEHKPTVGRATAALIKEGTIHKTSAEIAEYFDFFGASLSAPFSLDTSSLVMHSLSKYVHELLPLFAEIIQFPSFPEKELSTFVENSLQELQVELTKNDVLAYRKLSENIFGADHPYGYNSDETSYKNITVEDLKMQHQLCYHADNALIMLSGKVDGSVVKLLNQYLGTLRGGEKAIYENTVNATNPTKIWTEKKESSQTAITIGRRLFNRTHEDYAGLFVLNTILGGYFGSRLMENIREEKGYTYHIYSSIEPAIYDGHFYISTEVGNEFTKDTLSEIYKEIAILQSELISPKELKMVKNYLLGNMLNLVDGPFNVSDLYKIYFTENIDYQEFTKLIETIKNITALEIRDLAQRYLQPDDLWEVVVGTDTKQPSI
jgi:zinc protease